MSIIDQKRQFLYQPGPLKSIILWSWTLVLLFVSLILGLELLSQHQWIPWSLGALFLILTWAQIHYRRIFLEHQTLRVSRVINRHWVSIALKDVQNVHVSKHRLGFVYGGKIYQFLLPVNSAIELSELIHQAKNPTVEMK